MDLWLQRGKSPSWLGVTAADRHGSKSREQRTLFLSHENRAERATGKGM